jgi:hypothetical protein
MNFHVISCSQLNQLSQISGMYDAAQALSESDSLELKFAELAVHIQLYSPDDAA